MKKLEIKKLIIECMIEEQISSPNAKAVFLADIIEDIVEADYPDSLRLAAKVAALLKVKPNE